MHPNFPPPLTPRLVARWLVLPMAVLVTRELLQYILECWAPPKNDRRWFLTLFHRGEKRSIHCSLKRILVPLVFYIRFPPRADVVTQIVTWPTGIWPRRTGIATSSAILFFGRIVGVWNEWWLLKQILFHGKKLAHAKYIHLGLTILEVSSMWHYIIIIIANLFLTVVLCNDPVPEYVFHLFVKSWTQ